MIEGGGSRIVARRWIDHCGGDASAALARLRDELMKTPSNSSKQTIDRNIAVFRRLSLEDGFHKDVGAIFGITGSRAEQINKFVAEKIRRLLQPPPKRELQVQYRPVKPFRLPWAVVDFTSRVASSFNVVGRFKSEADARLFVDAVAKAEGTK